ncbi:hypothetical protein V5O48_013791 [Marasmius crinis-equi]|uniref:Uncharacterized protein n=1 Tax=Marasmius crinis-equi TaxID=585013 RepID=A0ABR3EZ89_9AGAR
MPRQRIHKSAKAQRLANRAKTKRYYDKNSEKIKTQKKDSRDRAKVAAATERAIGAKKREEGLGRTVNRTSTTPSLKDIRIEYNRLTNYEPVVFFEALFQKLKPYYLGTVQREENSSNTPVHTHLRMFSSLSDKISQLSARVLNESGAGAAFDEIQRAQTVIRHCLDAFPALCPLLLSTIQQEEADELLLPIVDNDIIPDLKTVTFRHHPASVLRHARQITIWVVPASEYLRIHDHLDSTLHQIRDATAGSLVHIIIYGLAAHDASECRLEEAERALIRVQMTKTTHYFFLEEMDGLTRSVYYSAAARNPFLCRFQQSQFGFTSSVITDIGGRYLNVLLQITGFTIPNARAVARAYPSPQQLWWALCHPSGRNTENLEEDLWERLQPWTRFLSFHLPLLSES